MKHGLRGKKSFETRSDWCLYIAAQKLWVRRILGISQTNPLTVVSSDPCSALRSPRSEDWCPWWGLRWCWRGTIAWGSFYLSGEWGGSAPREGGCDELLSDRWVELADLSQSLVSILEMVNLSCSVSIPPRYSNFGWPQIVDSIILILFLSLMLSDSWGERKHSSISVTLVLVSASAWLYPSCACIKTCGLLEHIYLIQK